MIQDKLHSPIFITGIERSGSTIIAKIIQSCGVWTGQTTEMLENTVMKRLVNGLYEFYCADARGQYPLPDLSRIKAPIDWKDSIEGILFAGRYRRDQPWMYKSARLGQTWPIWNTNYPNAKWIIVRRRTGDIIQSCLKTGFMTAFKNESNLKQINVQTESEGWLWWVHEHEKRFVEMIEAGLNCKVVWPERMAYGDYQQIYEMLDWLGLEWNDKIVDLVQPLLRNSKQKERV